MKRISWTIILEAKYDIGIIPMWRLFKIFIWFLQERTFMAQIKRERLWINWTERLGSFMLLDLKLLAEIRPQLRSVIYLAYMRTDIWYMVSVLSQVICEPKHLHTVTVKHIFRHGLRYTSSRGIWLHGFTNPDRMGSTVDLKGTSGYGFSLGSTMIS